MAGAIKLQTALIGQTDRRGFVARGCPCKTSAPDQTQSAELAKHGDCLPSKNVLTYISNTYADIWGGFVIRAHKTLPRSENG
jgi:hypothetical protein